MAISSIRSTMCISIVIIVVVITMIAWSRQVAVPAQLFLGANLQDSCSGYGDNAMETH